ncbi:MAG TPA: hypothetical protein VGI74_01040, partial [Streptosporangiaceae bacterium]
VRSVGGTYHQLSDDDIPAALLTFAQAENATQLVLGAARRSWRSALVPRTAIQSRVLRGSPGIDVHIVTRDTTRQPRGDDARQLAAPSPIGWNRTRGWLAFPWMTRGTYPSMREIDMYRPSIRY